MYIVILLKYFQCQPTYNLHDQVNYGQSLQNLLLFLNLIYSLLLQTVMPLQDFKLLEELGKGSFGTVHKCLRKTDNKIYAIKQVKIHQLKQKDKQNALNQIRLLASVQDSHIISYKEAFYDENSKNLCIVMEYANQGDLQGKIKSHIEKDSRFKEIEIWKTAYHLLKGCKKLHDSKVLHRDIKSANIFYCNGIAKLGDLNVSKFVESSFARTQTGTPYYAAPQIWSDQPYGPKCDIWSLGIVIYEMCMLKPPFRAQTFEGLYRKIMMGEHEKIKSCYSNSLTLFINRCLTVQHKKRATAQQLLQNFALLKDFQKQSSLQQLQFSMLDTINLPQNINLLNQKLPDHKYEQQQHFNKKKEKKPKTVVFEEISNKMLSPKRAVLPSIQKHKSEKHIPLLPNSSKIIPPSSFGSQKDLNVNKTIIKKIKSSKGLADKSVNREKKTHIQI